MGIANPDFQDALFSQLRITNQAVVTSGNYEKFALINGKRYSHIIDPRTGFPASGLKSVTIICANAELADGLATAVFVMGKDAGLYLINQLKGIEAIIIDDEGDILLSENISLAP